MNRLKDKKAFSLVELLVYVAIFAVSAVFLVAILTTFTRIQLRQGAMNEVNHQISFVSDVVKQLVQNSSLIDMTDNVTTSTLNLRMASSSLDPTSVYASGTTIYLDQGSSSPVALTNSSVNVTNFSVTKYENPGGAAIVQMNVSMSYNNPNPSSQFTQSLQVAVARISAATFDSSIYPASSTSLDLGSLANPWGNGYFSGNVNVSGIVYSGSGVSGATAMKANGNVGFTSSNQGLILMAPGGSCFLVGVNASGTLVTSAAACP
ncbi:type II secretion system GspH family protein [Patescibacteria group bacterium]|nr:type II secretion system GspH family protein [Patescibacteria group bacterium]